MQQDHFGLDIGFDSLKVVQLKKQGSSIHLVGYGKEKIPQDSWTKTGFKNGKKIGEVILKTLKQAQPKPIRANWVISALPESLVFTKVIEMPVMKKRELSQAIFYKLGEVLPLNPQDVYFDWQILDQQNGKFDCLLIAVAKPLVSEFIKVLKDINLELVALETKPLANCRALIKKGEKNGLIIADIGAEATSISLVDQETLRVTGTIPLGGDNLEKRNLAKNIQPLAEEIVRLLNYYHGRIKQTGRISKIRLCGGGANVPGIAAILTEKTGLRTELGNPWINITKAQKELVLPTEALSFTTAIGLALKKVQ